MIRFLSRLLNRQHVHEKLKVTSDSLPFRPQMDQIKQRLLDASLSVKLNENGMATFLFVLGNGRCVEISPTHGSNWWVEYWDDDDCESIINSVNEEEYESVDLLINSVLAWFSKEQ